MKFPVAAFWQSMTALLIDTLCVALITGVTLLLQAGVFATFFKETGTDTRALTDVLTSAHFYIIIICVSAVCVLAFFLIRNVAVFAKVRGILHNVWVGILSLKDVKQMPLFILYTVAIWICYFLQCDVGDILKFDGNLEEDENED